MEEASAPTGQARMKTRREPWVDVVRLLCIFCVCVGHCNLGCIFTTTILNQAAVGLFFVLAGYFDKKDDWRGSLKRIRALFLFYVAWILLYDALLAPGFTLQDYLSQLLHGSWSLWFIHHLIFLLALSCLFKKLCFAAKIMALIALLCLAYPLYPVWDYRIWSISLAGVFFFTGSLLNTIPLHELPCQLFPSPRYIPHAAAFGLAAAAMAAFVLLNAQGIHPVPETALVFLLMYALLLLSYTGSRLFPGIAQSLAQAGPAIILIYALNLLFLRAFISAYIHSIGHGSFPPYWLTFLVVVGMISGCVLAYRLLYGKNRWLNFLLFAR